MTRVNRREFVSSAGRGGHCERKEEETCARTNKLVIVIGGCSKHAGT
jgi:hypothetical protein